MVGLDLLQQRSQNYEPEVGATVKIIILLGQRNFFLRYNKDKLNVLWAILEPATLSFAYWFFVTQISKGSIGLEPYFLFIASGVLPWLWFSNSIRDSQSVFKSNVKILNSLSIQWVYWPVPAVISRLMDFLIGFIVVAGIFIHIYGFHAKFLWVIPAITLQAILTLSILYLLAPLVLLIPDLARLVSICLRIGFFITPILYLSVDLPSYVAPWIELNPLSIILQLYRHALFGSSVTADGLLWLLLSTGFLLCLGLIVSKSLQGRTLKALLP